MNHSALTAVGTDTIIGNYRVLEKIGSGGVGTVYKAQHRLLNQLAAIKVHEYFPEHGALGIAFRQAANCLSQIKHPNIIHLIDFGFFQSRAYMTMEYVEGTTLANLIPHSPGANWITQVIDIFPQILSAIRYAHNCAYIDFDKTIKRGIVHGDIKPENILISRADGTPKITDFMIPDVQKYIGDSASALKEIFPDESCDGLTVGEEVDLYDAMKVDCSDAFGTPDYMSPEQEEGAVSVKADIYTLGATLYKLVTGYSPAYHQGKGARGINPFVPQWMDDLIRVSMAPDPRDRYETVAEMEAVFMENNPSAVSSIHVSVKEVIMGDKIENNIGDISNVSGQLFIGKFNDVIATLNDSGQSELANGLKTLKEAILASQSITEEQKQEQVEVINQLGEAAGQPKPNKTILKMLGDGLLTTLKAVPDVAKVAASVSPLIAKLYL